MKEFVRFYLAPIDVEEDEGKDIFALVTLPDDIRQKNEAVAQISDSISAYVESVSTWRFEDLVRDVLDTSGFAYELIDPITICI